MRISFAWKLSFSITTLTFLVTGLSLGVLYFQARAMTRGQLQDRLMELSAAGTLFIDEEQRSALRYLSRRVRERTAALSPEERRRIETISEEDSHELFSDADSSEIMEGRRFQALVQSLRKVREATHKGIAPPAPLPSYDALPDGAWRFRLRTCRRERGRGFS